jgi:hypothetical protein
MAALATAVQSAKLRAMAQLVLHNEAATRVACTSDIPLPASQLVLTRGAGFHTGQGEEAEAESGRLSSDAAWALTHTLVRIDMHSRSVVATANQHDAASSTQHQLAAARDRL